MHLEGKTALVIGGATGIGAAIVARLVQDGARVCATGRSEESLATMIATLPAGTAIAQRADISSADDVDAAIKAAVDFGRGQLDIVVNNAGVGHMGTVEDGDLSEWHQTLDVNLTGPMLVMRAAVPHLRAAGGGAIVNISSVAGRRPFPGSAAYCVSKAGLIMLTQAAALDFGADNIRVNVVCPGWVRTSMGEDAMQTVVDLHGGDMENAFDMVSRDTPLGRVAAPAEVASIVSFLASDDASFVSGAVIAADGGSTLLDVSTTAFIDRRE